MSQYRSSFWSSLPPVVRNLLAINLIFWLADLLLPKILQSSFPTFNLTDVLGMHYWASEKFNVLQMLTYMFMHAGFDHLFFNMFAVYMFGRVLEQVWGPKRFLIFYMVTGIGAGLIQELTWLYDLRDVVYAPQELVNIGGGQILNKPEFYNLFVTVGASGAVFGILLAFGMMFPNVPLYIMFVPIPIKAKYFVIFYGLAELFLGVASFHGDSVAHFAHLGGMLFGYILIRIWRKKSLNNGPFYI